MSFPLLADFQPKGSAAASFGHYLAEKGITDRATVLIDKSGVIRSSVSVGPGGERNIDELAAECESVNAGQPAGDNPDPAGIPMDTCLFVKSNCGHSRRALLAVDNLGLEKVVTVRNVTDDPAAASALQEHGKDQAPCLLIDGSPMYEAVDIVKELAQRISPV